MLADRSLFHVRLLNKFPYGEFSTEVAPRSTAERLANIFTRTRLRQAKLPPLGQKPKDSCNKCAKRVTLPKISAVSKVAQQPRKKTPARTPTAVSVQYVSFGPEVQGEVNGVA
ncbi:hypothetical protein OSTOST_23145 [Ostertagia ostertagi]